MLLEDGGRQVPESLGRLRDPQRFKSVASYRFVGMGYHGCSTTEEVPDPRPETSRLPAYARTRRLRNPDRPSIRALRAKSRCEVEGLLQGHGISRRHDVPRPDPVSAEEIGGRHRLLARDLENQEADGTLAGGDDQAVGLGFEDRAGARAVVASSTGWVLWMISRSGPLEAGPGTSRSSRPAARAAWRGPGCGRPGRAATSRSARPPCGAWGPS